MSLPGHETTISTDPPAGQGPAPNTGVAFIIGLSDRGPIDEPVRLTSSRVVKRRLGGPVNYTGTNHWLEKFFQRGGAEVQFGRVVGPEAEAASVELDDSSEDPAVEVTAVEVGQWGNSLKVDLAVAPAFKLTVKLNDIVVEISPDLDTKADLIAWSEKSGHVRVTDAGGEDPVAASDQALTGGDDDRTNITTDDWQLAADRFPKELGPGQVLAPGASTAGIHALLLEHAAERNRWALLDGSSTDEEDLLGDAAAGTSTGNGRAGTVVAPPVNDGGEIPASILTAARLAYTDQVEGPGQYAAGHRFGDIGGGLVTAAYTDEELAALNVAGVQVIRQTLAGPRIYGFRSLAGTDSPWVLAAHARLIMALRTEFDAVMDQFVMRSVKGARFFAELEGALEGPCRRAWSRGDLAGESEDEAYRVVADESLNPPETLAQHELHAEIGVTPAPGAERILLNLFVASVADTI